MNRPDTSSKYNSYLEKEDYYNLEKYLEDLSYEDMLDQKDLQKIKKYIIKQLPFFSSINVNEINNTQSFTIEYFYRALEVLKRYRLEPEINNFIKKIEKKLLNNLRNIVF